MGLGGGDLQETLLEFKHQNLFIIFFTEILFYISFAMLLPTLPLYLAAFNIGTTQIGLVMSIFAIGLLGSRPYIGKFIDQYGARCTLRYGGGILTVYTLLYAVAPALIWVYPIRMHSRHQHGLPLDGLKRHRGLLHDRR